jgi:hypothetical protein
MKFSGNLPQAILIVYLSVPWKLGWIEKNFKPEPMDEILWKHPSGHTYSVPRVPWTLGWIQMNFKPEPMDEIL